MLQGHTHVDQWISMTLKQISMTKHFVKSVYTRVNTLNYTNEWENSLIKNKII